MLRRYAIGLALILVLLSLRTIAVGAAAISIHPLRQEAQLQPGQTTPKSLLVFNTTKDPEIVNVTATSFNTIDKHYDYSFGAPPDVSSWIQFIEDQATILPGAQHTFNYNIAVPNTAEPGGKYIAIFASIANKNKSTTIVERAGSLIYLSVTGLETRQGSLVSYTSPRFSLQASSPWDIQIQNKGNTHFTSHIAIRVTEWFGKTLSSSSQDHLILPGTIRELNGNYKLGRWPDVYHIKTSIGLGDNHSSQESLWLVYLPPVPSIGLLIVIGLVVGIMIRKLKRGRRPRKYTHVV